ncbi:MAG: efflux RND transporter periplasmic adaptor subunit [Deltaproteobacteria bacterium]|nr:efflux RND transporter periplasmic adaptor subunit [Deltaproteobacteria bacterium]
MFEHPSRAWVAVAVIAGCVLGCARESSRANPNEEGPPLRVVVVRPAPIEGEQTVELPGTLEPWEDALLYARVTGYLQSVSVDIGSEVKAGDELARIVVPEMEAQLQSAQAQLDQELAEVELASMVEKRLRGLRKANQEAIPQQDVDNAAAKRRVEAAQADLARAEVKRLKTLASFARLREPFDGRVTKRILHPGALVREGTTPGARPILEVARIHPLRLVLQIPEPLVPSVAVGSELEVHLDAFPGREFQGTIARVSNALDAQTRSMRAEVDFENDDGAFHPGMYGEVHLRIRNPEGLLTIPSRAVRGQGDERYVLVARDGFLHKQAIVVASDDGRRAVVARGLTTDALVMVAGSPLAREGSPCEPIEEGAK